MHLIDRSFVMAKAIGVPKTEDFMLKLFDRFVTGPHFKVAHMKVAPFPVD